MQVVAPAQVAGLGLAEAGDAQATMVSLRRVGIQVVQAHQVHRVLQERPDKRTFNKYLVRRGRATGPKSMSMNSVHEKA